MIYFFILVAFIAYFIQGKGFIKKGMRKELTIGGSILLLALFLQVGKSFGIITPRILLQKLFEPIGKMYLNQL